LQNDPEFSAEYEQVWLWADWPGRWGPDRGIDLVARTFDERTAAVQAKNYGPAHTVTKRDIDTFLSESNRVGIDSRLLIALTVTEASTDAMRAIAEEDPVMCVWWATELECVSVLARLEREGALSDTATTVALERLDVLAESWNEVQPVVAVRGAARRLLRVHALRAADALQLAAAVVAAEGQPASLEIVTLDERLAAAARREGFTVEASDRAT
jgi:predicted nucleic acid-binding protein